jgi:hypothetical protein
MASDRSWADDESVPVPGWYWQLSPDERETLGWPRYLPDRRRPPRPRRARFPRPRPRRTGTYGCRQCGEIHRVGDTCPNPVSVDTGQDFRYP